MIPKIILFSLFISSGLYSSAQPGLITFSSENNPDRSVSIYANSASPAEYTVKLTFSSLNGFTARSMATPDIALARVAGGNREILRLLRDPSANMFGFHYTSQYFPGRSFSNPADTAVEYLLPASVNTVLRVTTVSSTAQRLLNMKTAIEYRGTAFACKLGDTICASRAGIVYDCSDSVKEGEKVEVLFRRGRNRISIEHRDGTLGIYEVAAPIKLLVGRGDEVFPGQPLAVLNKESEKYLFFFVTAYLDERKLLNTSPFESSPVGYYTYMPTHFYVNETERSSVLQVNKQYAVQHSADIIKAEMTKREKKKFGF